MNEGGPDRLIGGTILIGLRYYDRNEALTRQEQIVGTIRSVDEDGVEVALDDGDTFTLPPFLWAIADAPGGDYQCRSAGRTIVNPDFLASWSLYDDPEDPSAGPSWKPNHAVVKNARDVEDWEFTYKPDFERIWQTISDRGESFVNKHLIIGMRYYKRIGDDEELVGQEQLHGVIVRVNRSEGIVIRLDTGEEKKLPPDPAVLQPAPPGEYRLRSTGETVIDPDYLSTWSRTSSPDDANGGE